MRVAFWNVTEGKIPLRRKPWWTGRQVCLESREERTVPYGPVLRLKVDSDPSDKGQEKMASRKGSDLLSGLNGWLLGRRKGEGRKVEKYVVPKRYLTVLSQDNV